MAYLTIAETTRKYGKSESTVRRFIRAVKDGGDKDKRKLIKPSDEEIADYQAANEQYSYTIAEELIEQVLLNKPEQAMSQEQGIEPRPQPDSAAERSIVAVLEQEIAQLREMLREEKKEKLDLLELAQEDKRLFANATGHLSQMLASPALKAAWKNNEGDLPIDGDPTELTTTTSEENAEPVAPTPHEDDLGLQVRATSEPGERQRKSVWQRVFGQR